MISKPARACVTIAALSATALFGGACSKDQPVTAANPTTAVTSPSATSKPKENVDPPATSDTGGGANGPKGTTKGTSGSGTTPGTKKTTVTEPKTTSTTKTAEGPEFVTQSVEAFRTKLGEFRAIELVVHVDSVHNAEVKVQDPAKPANVDDYEFDGTSVDGPVPVKLTGGGALEDNLFSVGEIAWDQIPAMMQQAVTTLNIDGSSGVTHLIVKKNLPFDDDTVVNIYVDGGPRTNGGYVSFKADGTLKKAYPPS